MKHIEPVKARILMLAACGWTAKEIERMLGGKPIRETIETWIADFGSTEDNGERIDLIADLAELFQKYGPNSKEVVAQTSIMLADGTNYQQKALAASKKALDYVETLDGEQAFEKIDKLDKLSKMQDRITGLDKQDGHAGIPKVRLQVDQGMKVIPLSEDSVKVEEG